MDHLSPLVIQERWWWPNIALARSAVEEGVDSIKFGALKLSVCCGYSVLGTQCFLMNEITN